MKNVVKEKKSLFPDLIDMDMACELKELKEEML